jgi:transcriptional regulator with XRE-family HTH domain
MAKPDKTRQIEPARELTPAQDLALAALLAGQTQEAAAEAAGVTRQTVSEWARRDSLFVATLNQRRQDLWAGHADRLRGLVSKAVDVLETGLDSPDERAKLAAAAHVFKMLGSLKPEGPTDARDVENEWGRDAEYRLLSSMSAFGGLALMDR